MDKFFKAVKILRPNTQMIWETPIETEENFNKVKWVTGVNSDNEAITTTTNPHSELSWAAVKAEMDKL
mgnify:FL=1|tara:strand:+ start:1000 stop:1203 length:204 start_codon:yes stop_codon:yes gene_type:complete